MRKDKIRFVFETDAKLKYCSVSDIEVNEHANSEYISIRAKRQINALNSVIFAHEFEAIRKLCIKHKCLYEIAANNDTLQINIYF